MGSATRRYYAQAQQTSADFRNLVALALGFGALAIIFTGYGVQNGKK